MRMRAVLLRQSLIQSREVGAIKDLGAKKVLRVEMALFAVVVVIHDPTTWSAAIEHGKAQGIPEGELDFLTGEGA
jgi:uncharacterized membrane protein